MRDLNSIEYCWVDTETTGLEFAKHRIIEIYCEVTDLNLKVIERFERKIRLSLLDKLAASPIALEVNGYSDEAWSDAVDSDEALWREVYRLTNRRILAGQNISAFDSKFIAAEMMRHNIRPNWDTRMQDTLGDCIRAMNALNIRSPKTGNPCASLDVCYDVLGGPSLPPHQAAADVQRSQFIFRKFDRAFRQSLELERVGVTIDPGTPAPDHDFPEPRISS